MTHFAATTFRKQRDWYFRYATSFLLESSAISTRSYCREVPIGLLSHVRICEALLTLPLVVAVHSPLGMVLPRKPCIFSGFSLLLELQTFLIVSS